MPLRTFAVLAAAVLSGSTAFAVASGTTLSGTARATAGDEVIIHGARVRLFGIVAPAPGSECASSAGHWPCGNRARAALARLVDGERLSCDARHRIGHGHWQAVCYLRGADVGLAQIRAGWARSSSSANPAYNAAQREAKTARKGIWRR